MENVGAVVAREHEHFGGVVGRVGGRGRDVGRVRDVHAPDDAAHVGGGLELGRRGHAQLLLRAAQT